jgi:hypothetical protein
MLTLPCRLAFGLMLALIVPAAAQQGPKTVMIPKCQNCTTKASQALQACMAGGNAPSCQARYQKSMVHCNKKFCGTKMTKVKVKN